MPKTREARKISVKIAAKETQGSDPNPYDEELMAPIETTEYEKGILAFSSLIIQLCYLKGIKPLKNEEMTVKKRPLNKVFIERIRRTAKVPTPKLDTATRQEKGKGKVESPVKDAPTSNEVWMKVLTIDDKIDDVTSTLGKVATTVQILTLHKTCSLHIS
ncbi:hypothetical protein V6N12_012764 [Hibiscus sabdariffa]|uniref:Uncharacterized protein n=1 Tax=Hibiscus sabdariffa TaxID=183260 RepID=A0ABR2EFC4_9ROSI